MGPSGPRRAGGVRSGAIARWLDGGLLPVAVGLFGFGLARAALLPGLGFWDTAELQTVGPLMGTAHPTGIPAWVLLGWVSNVVLAPFGDPAFRMNLLSAILLAVAAGLTAILARRLTGSTLMGLAAGVGLAATPVAWRIGTRAEAHALHLVLIVVLLLLLARWEEARDATAAPVAGPGAGVGRPDRWLVAAAAAYGIGLANHQLTLLLAPAIGLYVLAVEPAILRRPRLVLACLGIALGVAALLYLELPLRAGPFRAPLVYGHPETLEGLRYIVLAEQFRGSLDNPLVDLTGRLAELVGFFAAQFGPLAPLVPFGFLVTAVVRPRFALLTGLAFLATVVFAISYTNADIGRYYLGPIVIAWTWIAILGGTIVDRLTGPPEPAPWPDDDASRPPVLRLVLAALLAAILVAPTIAALPAREARIDESGDRTAQAWVNATMAALEPNAVVVSWWSFSTPLWYAQLVEGRRPDVFIVDDRTRLDLELGEVTDVIDAYLGSRPVYAIRTNERELSLLRLVYQVEALPVPSSNVLHITGRRLVVAP